MVGKICTVCRNSSFMNRNLSFFTYPADPQRRYDWLKAVDRLDLHDKLENNKTRGNHRICEVHFEDKYIKKSSIGEGRKFLLKNASPTLNLERKSPVRYPQLTVNISPLEENPEPCMDLSKLCESVMKVSKATQTPMQLPNSNKFVNNDFFQKCDRLLPEGISQLVKWQLHPANNTDCENFNLFALGIYYSGANSYNFLKNVLNLPPINVLRHYIVPKTTKLSDNCLNALKSKVNNMSTQEKICSVSIGSILLKANLYYNIQFDRIIGFHDVDGEQNTEPAKYAIIIMAQGIVENWKQPIAYSFVADYENYLEVSLWVDEVISILIDIGLDVRAFVSDPRSEFLYASETRHVTPEKPYFTINAKNIYYIYDSLQLLKVVKNNLKSCDLNYENQNAEGNVDLFKKLNNLHEMLNSRTKHSNSQYKSAFCNKQYQLDYLQHMSSVFQNLKVARKIDGVDVTENMKFVSGFLITIKSVMQLFQDLHSNGIKYLLTSRLGQNNINKFLTRVKKNIDKEECTGRQFNSCFVKSFVCNMLKRPLGSCTGSSSSMEIENYSQQLLSDAQADEVEDNFNKPLMVFTTDYRVGLPERNAFGYVCKYLFMKCLKNHICDELKIHIHTLQDSKGDDSNSNLSFDNLEDDHIIPPEAFTDFLMQLESKFVEFFDPNVQINSIGQEILRELKSIELDMPCQCFPVDYLKTLFVRLRIYFTVRENNKMFRNKKGAKSFKVFSL